MKILIDFFPILLFFGTFKVYGIYVGTAVLMAATVVQMGLIYKIDHKLQMMHKITLALVLIFGTLTLVLQDDRFIKWKPTVLYAAMAFGLAVALWIMKKNFLKLMLGQPIDATRQRLDAPQPDLDCLLRLHVRHQRLCGGQLQHRGLGRLQAVGLCLPAGLYRWPGLLYFPLPHGRRIEN